MDFDDGGGGWTLVRYGRRRNYRPRTRDQWQRGRAYRGMDRAPPGSSQSRVPNPRPNRPVPPSGRPGHFFGPQPRSYAAAVRGGYPATGPSRTQSFDTRDQTGYQRPADPKFSRLVRKLHSVIKLVHHLQNVSMKPGKAEPLMIARTVDMLASMIKPAHPNATTMDLVMGNAKNWGHNTLLILKDHYTDGLETILRDLPEDLGPDWKDAFTVATRWARKNLPRITREVIDHAEALVTASASDPVVAEPTAVPLRGAEAAAPLVGHQPTQTMMTIQPTAGTQVGQGVQVSRSHSVATMTDGTQTEVPVQMVERSHDPVEDLPPPIVAPREQRRQRTGHQTYLSYASETGAPVLLRDISPSTFQTSTSSEQSQATSSSESTLSESGQGTDSDDTVQENPQDSEQNSERDITPYQVPAQDQADQLSTPRRSSGQVQSQGSSPNWSVDSQADIFTHLTSTPEQQLFRVRRHINTPRKMADWDLTVEKRWLIIGDSNLSRLPDFPIQDLQIESYPGANFRHAQSILEKTDVSLDVAVEKVVLAFGINSRAQLAKETSVKQLQGALRTAKRVFPFAEIWIPLVNFSSDLPSQEQTSLDCLNTHVTKNMPHIPLLDESKFSTEDDDIHWTVETAMAMFDHWVAFLNLATP